ncbi:MAG: hypothetical protein ACPG7F_17790 [Aggregatilineales bacterium]
MDVYELDKILSELTPHRLKVIEAIYSGDGEWMSRTHVAKALGKRRLTPYDINCLDMLSETNIIVQSTRPTTAPGSDFAYIYNMSDEMVELLQTWTEMKKANPQARLSRRKPLDLVSY